MSYETIILEIESEDLQEWREGIEEMGFASSVEYIRDYGDGSHEIAFDTREPQELMATLRNIADKRVLYIRDLY